MSFVTDLVDSAGGEGVEDEVVSQVTAEGAEYIQNLGRHVRDTDLSMQELSSRVSVLLDDVTSAKSTRETLEALQRSRDAIEAAKALSRKFTIWLSGTPGVRPQVKLQKEKLMSSLEHSVHTFNSLSDQVNAAMMRANTARSNEMTPSWRDRHGTGDMATTSTTSGSSGHDTTSMLALSQDLRKVQSNFEATQVIFDELGTLVRQQAPHLDSLESQASNTRHYSKEAANELQKEYQRRSDRTKRNWGCFMCVLLALLFVLYTYGGAYHSPPTSHIRGTTVVAPPSPVEVLSPPLSQTGSLSAEKPAVINVELKPSPSPEA